MNTIILVGVGGFLGSVCRYGVSAISQHYNPVAQLPCATLIVNVLGALLVGIVAHALESIPSGAGAMRLLIITGFLGGFTTFSAFSLESAALLRQGLMGAMLLNITANVVLSILAVFLGFAIGKALF